MKRMILALACAAALASAIPAQGVSSGAVEYKGTVDFSKTIADFSGIAKQGDTLALRGMQNKAFFLFGTLTGEIPREDEPYLALAEFLEGEWKSSSQLLLHRVLLVFSGESFRELLDGPSGLRAVAFVQNPRLEPAPDGHPVIYLDVIAIRPVF